MTASTHHLAIRLSLLPTIVARCRGATVAALVGLAVGAPLRADGDTPSQLTATGFLERVEASHPQLEGLQGAIDAEAATVTAAGLWSNPTVAYSREETFSADGRWPENTLQVALPLELSGRRGLQVEGAELGVGAARQAALHAKGSLLLDALEVYLQAAAARDRLAALEEEQVSLRQLLTAVQTRAAAGDASGYDLDRLALEADALHDLVDDAARQRMALRRALGLLAGGPGSLVDAADALALPASPPPADEAAAVAAHPAYRATSLRLAQADKELEAADRGWLPSVSLTGGAKSVGVITAPQWGYVAGLAITVPLLDHGQADAQRAQAHRRMAKATQRHLEQQVKVEVQTRTEALLLAIAQARQFEAIQLARLDRLLKTATASYQEGEHPVFELLDAHRTARAIRLRAIELRLQARLAELDLWRARGVGPGAKP